MEIMPSSQPIRTPGSAASQYRVVRSTPEVTMYKHQKTILATTIAVAATSILSFSSVAADEQELRQEILNLKHKVERLEKSRIPLVTEEDVQEEVQSSWFENISFSGLVEVEASYFDSPDGSESDIAVSTVELGIDAQLNHWVNAHVLILYEEDAMDPPEIDPKLRLMKPSSPLPTSKCHPGYWQPDACMCPLATMGAT